MLRPYVIFGGEVEGRLHLIVGPVDVLGEGVEVAEAAGSRAAPREGRGASPREHVVAVGRRRRFLRRSGWLRSED